MAFSVDIEARRSDGEYRHVGEFAARVVSGVKIRARIDQDEWSPGVSVLDDLTLQIYTGSLLLASAARPDSAFSGHLRERGRVSVYRGRDEATRTLVWRGYIKDSDSPYDLVRGVQKIHAVSAATALRDEIPPSGALASGMSWKEAMMALLHAHPYAVSFDDDFSHIGETGPLDIDALRVGDAAPLERLSIFDGVNSLLAPLHSVAIIRPDGSVLLRPRDAAPDATAAVTLTRATAHKMQLASGGARAIQRVEVPFAGGRAIRATGEFGGGARVSLDTEWLGTEGEAVAVAEYILDLGLVPRQEVKVTWPARAGVPGLLDRIDLHLGDGDPVEGAALNGARLSGNRPEAAFAGSYRAYDISYDLRSDEVSATIRV